MRYIASTLMVFMIFTSFMTCEMLFCPMQAHAASSSEVSTKDLPPCHQDGQDDAECNLMANIDCVGIDLFPADDGISLDHNSDHSTIDLAWADLTNPYVYEPGNIQDIRGPPFNAPRINSQLTYLTTQRIRI
jgi:hypothetical protein